MKTQLAIAMAASLSLGACKTEDDQPPMTEEQQQQAVIDQAKSDQDFLDQHRFPVDVTVTRNGQDLTLSVQALCYAVENDADYKANCTIAAELAMREKFACSSYPFAAGSTRTTNPDILSAGWTGAKDTVDTRYLYTEEKWIATIDKNLKRFSPDNYYVIESVSDRNAATTPVNDDNRPYHCPDFYS